MPTEKEWELVASNMYDIETYPYGQLSTQLLVKRKLLKNFNCIYKDSIFQNNNDSLPTIIDSYIKNTYGCYNLNVSEIVAEKGIVKGVIFFCH